MHVSANHAAGPQCLRRLPGVCERVGMWDTWTRLPTPSPAKAPASTTSPKLQQPQTRNKTLQERRQGGTCPTLWASRTDGQNKVPTRRRCRTLDRFSLWPPWNRLFVAQLEPEFASTGTAFTSPKEVSMFVSVQHLQPVHHF